MAYKFQYADWVAEKTKPFNRHDLEYSEQFLGQLRMQGRRRRIMYKLGHFDIKRAQSTAMRNLTNLVNAEGVFLDAGCGDSPDADLALELGFDKAYAIDLFPRAKVVNGYWKGPHKVISKATFILGDLCEILPIQPRSVDAISCNWVLPLMSEEDRWLFYEQVKRMLKPNGVFSVTAAPMVSGYGNNFNSFYEESYGLKKLEFTNFSSTPSGIICYKPSPPKDNPK